MKTIHYLYIPFTFLLLFTFSCKKPISYTKNHLNFSTDSLLFDTIFTTIGSTTKQFKIYNNNASPIKIEEIELMGGDDSPFRINIDGVSGVFHSDLELRKKDSIFAFVEVTLEVNNVSNPLVISDSIRFRTNGKDQYIHLDVWGQDAYFHVNEIVGDSYYLWQNDKPHVIYGAAVVGYPGIDSNLTLTIPAGTEIYNHKNAVLLVYKSTLNIQGQMGNEVVFQGDRLESFYDDVPGQWWGIWLSQAKNCNIDYAVIKNGSVGLQVDTTSSATTLNLSNTIIDNNDFNNLLINAGANVLVENCVFGKSGGTSVFLFAGGTSNFNNCSFVNYWTGSRGGPAFALRNWYELENGTIIEKDVNSTIQNSVIYGNSDEEFVIDSIADGTAIFNVNVSDAVIKRNEIYNYSYLTNVIWNTDPLFVDITLNDFHVNTGSPLIDNGNSSTATSSSIDGISRGTSPDIGAYEFN
ncbi:MAG: choice-of-anchor Q domain-containing protein [Putridiphycobacter sp.]